MILQVLLPPKARGTVTYLAPPGNYTIKDKILETEFDGQKTEYTLMQVCFLFLCKWAGANIFKAPSQND